MLYIFHVKQFPQEKKGFDNVPMLKQVCIIPFKREYLLKFNDMEETELEKIESVDMMRIIENGDNVKMVMTDSDSFSVDTEEDRLFVEEKMTEDQLMKNYKNNE